MIKYFFSILLFLPGSSVYAQFTVSIQWQKPKSGGDTIYYNPDRKLDWEDFKGVPVDNSIAAAITESGFGYRMSMNSINGKTNVSITVMCYFNKRRSWVKQGMNTDYALTHEQHHFDITYINTCLFIQKLRAAKFTADNFAALVDKIHDECYNALDKMQDEYDGQTMNGRLRREQFAWNKKIDQQLESLITN
jgi:hypothetical protein